MSTKDIVYIALFAAITAAMGLFPAFTLPIIAVPITAQSMGPMLAGAIAGGRGGVGIFLGPSGGFILAWPIAALLIGYLYEKNIRSLSVVKEAVFITLGGIVIIYSAGIPWISAFAKITLSQAAIGAMGFIPGDIIKVILTVLIVRPVRKAYPTLESR
jgi:biotin transport system substrate-specific component